MCKYSAGLAAAFLVICVGLVAPSHAQAPGYVRVVFAKAGLIVGADGGRGVLTYRGRHGLMLPWLPALSVSGPVEGASQVQIVWSYPLNKKPRAMPGLKFTGD
jgi:hypothetical protein